MNKNVIIQHLVNGLMDQRKILVSEIADLNHNEASFMERRSTLNGEIANIDMQLDRRITDCEISTN